jgi:D-alanyl-D-alanine carboxypeptidase (penicillin-binding protein 5/6)
MARFAHKLRFILLAAVLAAAPFPSFAATKKKPATKATTAKKPRPATPKPSTPRPTAAPPKATPRPVAAMLADGNLELAAEGAIVIDAYTGAPLFEKNPDSTQYPASTTKIMTALLVIEAGNLDEIVEVTDEDSKVGESGLSIKPGEHYTRRQMLFGLMLKSANDVAHALGRDNAGTMPAFAEKMTLRAHELGANNTSFRNPHGLHDVQHFTNARDLAAITRAAMQQPYFRKIVSTLAFTWERTDGPWVVGNHNRLLKEFPGCTGVKTGFTRPAQQVLASAALKDGREVIAVVMHTNRPGIWEDSKLLLTYGMKYPPGTRPLGAIVTPEAQGGN